MRFPQLLLVLALPAGFAAETPDAVVAADGSGDYRSIQEAVMAAPYRSGEEMWIIQVKPGTYKERVYVQRERGNLRLIGEDAQKTILTHEIHARMEGPDGEEIGTFATPTLRIDGDRFEIENLTIANTAGPVAQALALRVDGDRVVFRECRFLGWQDTILLNRGRQYFEDCYIEGHCDFIFGGAAAWFEDCQIHCLRDGYITAASTPPDQDFGFVFHRCRITGEEGVRTYLGRPWRPHAMTVFLDTRMSEVVRPEGWHNWNDPERERTVRYGEHRSSGPGAAADQRVAWADRLDEASAARLNPEAVLDGWNPTPR